MSRLLGLLARALTAPVDLAARGPWRCGAQALRLGCLRLGDLADFLGGAVVTEELLTLDDAAARTPWSTSTLRRAIKTTDPHSFPPPPRYLARRVGLTHPKQ